MMLLDLSHTAHTRARTGVQRVCRSLYAELSARGLARGTTFDPYRDAWRELQSWELANLRSDAPGKKRSARWPLLARWRGRAAALTGKKKPNLLDTDTLIVPEIFSPTVARALPDVFARVRGARIALFHDAIALKFPERSPAKTVARFPAYLRELATFDGIAAVSNDSRQALTEYWTWLGVPHPPPVVTISLGLGTATRPAGAAGAPTREPPIVLSVGSLEGRKNHLSLLEACEDLWSRGLQFQLHLIGFAQRETGREALARVEQLIAAGRPLRYDGAVDDQALEGAYAACTFTVYPSLMEGFGLPVLESLQHGKPCICSRQGALGEAAADGGCLTVDAPTRLSLADAIETLITSSSERDRLRQELQRRRFRSWRDYVDDFVTWSQTVRRRS